MKHKHYALIATLILAGFLRFFQLGTNPPGLYWDEVSLGYNAYSILKTGRDEHDRFLPIDTFKAFGDYKPPGYIYATVPSIALFGLNNFAVRFPSALAGTLLVLVTYFLVKELFNDRVRPSQKNQRSWLFSRQAGSDPSETLALLSALFLAISPWSIQLSRVAFEANLAALFNTSAVFFFLKSRHRPWWLLLAVGCWLLAIYTFNANRILSFLMAGLMSLVYFRHLWRHKLMVILVGAVGILALLPLVPHLRSTEGKLRWNEVNIFSNLDVIIESNARIAADGGGRLAKLVHHRYLGHARNFLHHYLDHFYGRYLFITGDANPRFSLQDIGQLYLIELPFLLVGLSYLIRYVHKRTAIILIGWLLLAPVPAAMARETPHALRTVSMLPVPQIIVALGFVYLLGLARRSFRAGGSIFILVSCILYLVSFTYFHYNYYHNFSRDYAGEWLTGYPKLVEYLKTSREAQAAQTITVVPDYGRPYIYFLFYNQYQPAIYAKTVDRTGDVFGFFDVHGFDKYHFQRVDSQAINSGDIYVVRGNEIIDGFSLVSTITDINGYPQFNVLKKM